MNSQLKIEVICRFVLLVVFCITDEATPFYRVIQDEEWWLYKNPRRDSYVPSPILWCIVIGIPFFVILAVTFLRKDKNDAKSAALGVSFSVFLAGSVINFIKLIVGRPRPDFFYRCWPDGHQTQDMTCTGDQHTIIQGRKSFPSGHSGLSFSSLAFLSFYLMGKLHIFTTHGRGEAWRVLVSFTPAFGAVMIALSRTADYHHHWQDVLIGSLIGLSIAYLCYRQYYPSLWKGHCHRPLSEITPHEPSSPAPHGGAYKRLDTQQMV